jgi:hypothetical protein
MLYRTGRDLICLLIAALLLLFHISYSGVRSSLQTVLHCLDIDRMARVLHTSLVALLSLGVLCSRCHSFSAPNCPQQRKRVLLTAKSAAPSSRRSFGVQIVQVIGVSSVVTPGPANAKISQVDEDKDKIYKGYERLNFLLDNWLQETTICGQNDNPYVSKGGCERTPLKVMEYLGYRNVNDPLFKADKTMRRLEGLVPADRETEYLEAMEKWMEAADEGSGMAFISSWGEANPGGGKDRVELFIERAKKNVVDSRDSLGTVIDILGIKKDRN